MVITMIPSFTLAAELPFTDVDSSAWFYSDVKSAFETGLVNGMTDTTFEPESNMTYAQAVKLAACMNQKYSTGSVTLKNGSPDWWDSYAAYAKEKGIISKDYDWNSNATRAGYVEIFAKALPDEALKEKNHITDGYIPDVGMTHPQSEAIYKLYRAGVLTGTDDQGTFDPNSNIRRCEVAAILIRMMDESARKELTLEPAMKKVVFDSTGGSAVETQQVAQYGKIVKPADPAREGYVFAGWYNDRGLTAAFDFDSRISEDQYLYAKWKKAEIKRQNGERFEDVITIEGMEETVQYEHVRNEKIGFEIDYDYEKFRRQSAPDSERFISRYDESGDPQNYLEVKHTADSADTVSALVSEVLSRDYEIITESIMLDRAGECIRIDASEVKGGGRTSEVFQTVYIIPAADGCYVATERYVAEDAEGFGKRLSYMMNTFSVIDSQREKRLSDEQALMAIEKYCYLKNPDLKDIVEAKEYPVSWGVISMNQDPEIVVLFRSYTGAEVRYYIDPVSGDTHVTELVSGITSEEVPTDERLNVWDYID